MRLDASVLHLDLDAFYAAVEQRDKPSLRGKPVVVGGLGPRGVVATASYEARRYGVRSAMSMAAARARCPRAAFLAPRFEVYRHSSYIVMAALRERSPVVEPLSLDEAYVDLGAGRDHPPTPQQLTRQVASLRADVARRTGGLTASVGLASSKLLAKVASELAKPDGWRYVPPGSEAALLAPLPVTALPGVGPATTERLRRAGATRVADLVQMTERELISLVGASAGRSLHRLARAEDDRPVEVAREARSVSVEDTFDVDLVDVVLLRAAVARMAAGVCDRLSSASLSGRTVTLKMRRHDFTTQTRSATLPGPTDDRRLVTQTAVRLLADVDTSGGVRLLGVGLSGLADWRQDDLFGSAPESATDVTAPEPTEEPNAPGWRAGADVFHAEHGRGWVWGSGSGRVTVRFETAATPVGPVRTFAANDPVLSRPAQPAPIAFGA